MISSIQTTHVERDHAIELRSCATRRQYSNNFIVSMAVATAVVAAAGSAAGGDCYYYYYTWSKYFWNEHDGVQKSVRPW